MKHYHRLKNSVKHDSKCINGIIFSKNWKPFNKKFEHEDLEYMTEEDWKKEVTPIPSTEKKRTPEKEAPKVEREPEEPEKKEEKKNSFFKHS